MKNFKITTAVISLAIAGVLFSGSTIHAQETIGNENMDNVIISNDMPMEMETPSDDTLNNVVEDFEQNFEEVIEESSGPDVEVPYSGQYYDSNSVRSSSSLRQDAAPLQVDPKYVPGSRYVIVRKDAEVGTFQARLTAAQRANDLGRYSAALELYERLYNESPKSKSVLLGLAVAQQNSGFNQSAIGTYEELLNIDSKNIDAEVNMLGLIMQQYPAVAFQRLVGLWEHNSSNPAIAAQVGLTSAKLGNIEDAMRFLGIAISLEPNNPNHYYNLAVVTDRAGAYNDAIDFYQKALEVDAVYGSKGAISRPSIYDRLAKLRRL